MFDALLLDFYGTLVHEDDDIIRDICNRISTTAISTPSPGEVGRYWSSVYSAAFTESHGPTFRTQRDIEISSLADTIDHFGADCDPHELCLALFDHWTRPPLFADTAPFLASVDVPVVIVSNIDRPDIEQAIDHHGLDFDAVVTSEDVRSYKPRPELFSAGLDAVGVPVQRALHIGDSLTSDVAGAARLGLSVVWVNRKQRPTPAQPRPTHVVVDLEHARRFL